MFVAKGVLQLPDFALEQEEPAAQSDKFQKIESNDQTNKTACCKAQQNDKACIGQRSRQEKEIERQLLIVCHDQPQPAEDERGSQQKIDELFEEMHSLRVLQPERLERSPQQQVRARPLSQPVGSH